MLVTQRDLRGVWMIALETGLTGTVRGGGTRRVGGGCKPYSGLGAVQACSRHTHPVCGCASLRWRLCGCARALTGHGVPPRLVPRLLQTTPIGSRRPNHYLRTRIRRATRRRAGALQPRPGLAHTVEFRLRRQPCPHPHRLSCPLSSASAFLNTLSMSAWRGEDSRHPQRKLDIGPLSETTTSPPHKHC
jgi:hypothetical protein